MAGTALALYVLYLALAFGLRTLIQWRRTGSTGFHGVGGKPGSTEWLAGVGFSIALLLGGSAPVLALLGALEPVAAIDDERLHLVGLWMSLGGIGLTFLAQVAMGDSWRIGVDENERTELVTSGPFALVRNPIFAAMIPTGLGLALLVPSVVALVGFLALVIALEVQVRVVEEPYLRRVHGDEYLAYARRTGRFMPGVGRLS